ncbi:MAG TPA: FAD binding domain-containing protein [Acidimicrobiia bacterium]|nr:FAD binding domain-containing protein [Acidimicrobiia bacterium]
MNLHPVQQHRLSLRRYIAPPTLDEALRMLEDLRASARLVAGGSDLLLELARGQRPGVDTLIDVSRLPGLDLIKEESDHLVIGAGVTHNQAATSLAVLSHALPLAQACWEVASPQLRNRATIVGNVVTASPANDTISALRALGTGVDIVSSNGSRSVDLAEFHTGVRQTVLAPGEMVVALRVKKVQPSERGVFVKLGLRRAQAISVVHMAAVVDFDGTRVRDSVLALGSVAPTIVTTPGVSAYLAGRELDEATLAEAAGLAADSVSPIDDLRATAEYRRETLAVMVRRALESIRDGTERTGWEGAKLTLSRGTWRSPSAAVDLGVDTKIEATVNRATLTAPGAAGRTLLDWLRDELGLTGTKEGCAEGECGACTVFLDEAAVMSCLVPAGRAAGAEITTIEGLASVTGLHPLQQAFIDAGAVQCGFCIPGFLMSGAMLLEERPHPDDSEIRTALAGNLCRCTGYYKIMDAFSKAATE